MSKLSLATVSNPENQTSFVNQLNNNFDSTETWSDSVLSRDGTSPNSMEADLDMNSNSILNLPAPTLSTEPLRLGDLPSLLPTIIVQNTEPGLAYTAGSLWIDSDSTDYDLYQLVAGVWTDTGVDLEGATGATGPQGESGVVTSDVSVTDENLVAYDGTDGDIIKDSGIALANVLVDADIGTTVQAHDDQLDDIAALAVTNRNVIVADGTNWTAENASAMVGAAINAGTSLTDLADDDEFGVLDASDSTSLKPVAWSIIKSELDADGFVTASSTDTLTNKTIDANGTGNSITNIETADIATAAKSGADTTLITGTEGANGNLAQWNSDGDLVDASLAVADVVTGSSTDTFTNKTFDANGTGNSISNIETADIATAAKTGVDTTLVTGTEGSDGHMMVWNADGDAVAHASGAPGTAAFKNTGTSGDAVPLLNTNVTFSNATDYGILRVQGDDGKGVDIISGRTITDQTIITSQRPVILMNTNTNELAFFVGSSSRFYADGVEHLRADGEDIMIGGSTQPASATKSLVLYNGTAPTGSVTDGVVLYAQDTASSSELKVRDEAGNISTLSPHNFTLFEPDPDEPSPWSYYSRNAYTGEEVNVDMAGALKALEELTGKTFVHRRKTTPQDWEADKADFAERQRQKAIDDAVLLEGKTREEAELAITAKPVKPMPKWLNDRVQKVKADARNPK